MEFRIPSRQAFISTANLNLTGQIGTIGVRGFTGATGPTGATDATSIVGYPVVLSSGQAGDLLSFTGSEWTNKPMAQVTDGGNW